MTAPRRRLSLLTARDLARIGAVVDARVKSSIPEAMHAEFLKVGLATGDEQDQLEAQKDFAFLRSTRRGSEDMKRFVGHRTIAILLSAIALVISAGLGALITRAQSGG